MCVVAFTERKPNTDKKKKQKNVCWSGTGPFRKIYVLKTLAKCWRSSNLCSATAETENGNFGFNFRQAPQPESQSFPVHWKFFRTNEQGLLIFSTDKTRRLHGMSRSRTWTPEQPKKRVVANRNRSQPIPTLRCYYDRWFVPPPPPPIPPLFFLKLGPPTNQAKCLFY